MAERFRLTTGKFQTVTLPKSDFGESQSSTARLDPGTGERSATGYDSIGRFGLDRRKYRRIALDVPATLVHEGRHEGPCDVSRGGAGVIAPVEPPVGTDVQIVLPPDEVEGSGLSLQGSVVRTQTLVEPVERGGLSLPTFHCFTCGWSGFWDPITQDLATTVRRHSDSTFGAAMRLKVDGATVAGQPAKCPICGTVEPTHVTRGLHRIGLRLDRLGPRDTERLTQYVERAVMGQGGLGRREHQRVLAEYVPVRIDCAFATPAELANTYLRDISQGGIGFTSSEDLPLRSEVRVAIRPKDASEGFVLQAHVVSRQPQGDGWRYGARFSQFDESLRSDLRGFIEGITDQAVARTERTQQRSVAVRRLAREVWIGIAIGVVTAIVVAVVVVVVVLRG